MLTKKMMKSNSKLSPITPKLMTDTEPKNYREKKTLDPEQWERKLFM